MDILNDSTQDEYINLESLYEVHKKRDINKVEVYRLVFQKCIDKIRQTNDRLQKMECIFEVPTFLWGTPIYDYDDLKSYIIHRLTENGIVHCYFIDQNNLFMSWRPEHIDKKRYQTAKRKYTGYDPTPSWTPSTQILPDSCSGSSSGGSRRKKDKAPSGPDPSGMIRIKNMDVPVNMDKVRRVGNVGRSSLTGQTSDYIPRDSTFMQNDEPPQAGEMVQRVPARQPPSRQMLDSWHRYFARIRGNN